jgi:type II secretory pathway pseudopilin PulG
MKVRSADRPTSRSARGIWRDPWVVGIRGLGQVGFSLVELVMALGVTAILSTGIIFAIRQVFDTNARSSNHMVAIRQVQNVGYWVSRDSQMAQSVSGNATHLVLGWTDWLGGAYQVTYIREGAAGSYNIRRMYSASGNSTGNSTNILVGQHIESVTWVFPPGDLNLSVKATMGTGSTASSETRTYSVKTRPGS